MPPEYYAWLTNLAARDTIVLVSALAGVSLYLLLRLMGQISPAHTLREHLPPRYALGVILLAGTALRLLFLGQQSMWYDEAFSALVAQRPLPDVLAAAANDYHPPLYFMVLWAWSRVWPWAGFPADAWLRLPSALFGLGNIWLTWRVAAYYRRPAEALTAAALMAVLPFQVAYSQEARMYQMMLCLALLTWLGYRHRRWWLVILAGAGLLYTQSMSAFFLAGLGLAAALFDRSRLKALVWSGAAIALLHLPWVLWGLAPQLGRMGGGHYWIPQITPGASLYLWHVLLWHEANPLPIVIPGMVVSMLLITGAVWHSLRHKDYFVAALAFLPPLLAIPASMVLSPVLLPRTFITCTPAFVMLLAASWRAYRPATRRILGLCLVAMIGVGLLGYFTNPKLQKWPQREWATDLILDRYQPGDIIYYLPQSLPFLWYLPPTIPQYFLPQDQAALNAGFNLTNETTAALGLQTIQPDDLTGLGAARVFVIFGRSPATGQYQLDVWAQLSSRYPVIWRYQFVDDRNMVSGEIALLDLRGSRHGLDERH